VIISVLVSVSVEDLVRLVFIVLLRFMIAAA
jgi:hypothetical protein